MGYISMAKGEEVNSLFAWLVEEVGELGRVLIRKRIDSGNAKKELESELADVWNTFMALGFKLGYTPSKLKALAEVKAENHEDH